jgi:hypothetical protein
LRSPAPQHVFVAAAEEVLEAGVIEIGARQPAGGEQLPCRRCAGRAWMFIAK